MNWDPFQREVLEALGHVVLERAPAPALPVPDDALVHALLRAAGRTPVDDDAGQLCRDWSVAELRSGPAAKRALWPRLRALRASSAQAGGAGR